MNFFIPMWLLVSGSGVGLWYFGFKIPGAVSIAVGLVMGGFISVPQVNQYVNQLLN